MDLVVVVVVVSGYMEDLLMCFNWVMFFNRSMIFFNFGCFLGVVLIYDSVSCNIFKLFFLMKFIVFFSFELIILEI